MKYEHHPYIIYVRTPRVRGQTQYGDFYFNNYGFSSCEDTNIVKTKKRVICIGGSTTELSYGAQDNTYPAWLGRYLGDEYEVLNAGVCCYTTAEMLINFELRLVDFKPDYVVIYEAINDVLYSGMLKGFRSDYTHNRKNIGLEQSDSRDLTAHINTFPLTAAKEIPMEAVGTFKRNLRSICAIAIANNIKPVIVKFNYNPAIDTAEDVYPLSELGINDSRDVFRDGLSKYIQALKEVSEENPEISYVETEPLFTEDFIDSCHFVTSGMQKMGKSISDFIKQTKGE